MCANTHPQFLVLELRELIGTFPEQYINWCICLLHVAINSECSTELMKVPHSLTPYTPKLAWMLNLAQQHKTHSEIVIIISQGPHINLCGFVDLRILFGRLQYG